MGSHESDNGACKCGPEAGPHNVGIMGRNSDNLYGHRGEEKGEQTFVPVCSVPAFGSEQVCCLASGLCVWVVGHLGSDQWGYYHEANWPGHTFRLFLVAAEIFEEVELAQWAG